MTCPKCGYVSFPGLPQCKKCGHPLTQTLDSKATLRPLSNPYEPISLTPPEMSVPSQTPAPPSFSESGRAGETGISRLRRAKSDKHRETSLKLDFEAAGAAKRQASDFLDRAFETSAPEDCGAGIAAVPLEGRSGARVAGEPPDTLNRSSESPARTGRSPVEPAKHWTNSITPAGRVSSFRQAEMPLVLDTPFMNSADQAESPEPATASLRKRFLALLIDAGILVLAGCLFAGLFAIVKGRLQASPLNLLIGVGIAAFWIFVYFGSFTLVAFHTPGQAACGLTVANLDGERPTRHEAFLRAFGYLVSLAALLLGFIWAAMDSDGMAWHDHISGTILIESA